jgi:hypothetical protein
MERLEPRGIWTAMATSRANRWSGGFTTPEGRRNPRDVIDSSHLISLSDCKRRELSYPCLPKGRETILLILLSIIQFNRFIVLSTGYELIDLYLAYLVAVVQGCQSGGPNRNSTCKHPCGHTLNSTSWPGIPDAPKLHRIDRWRRLKTQKAMAFSLIRLLSTAAAPIRIRGRNSLRHTEIDSIARFPLLWSSGHLTISHSTRGY